MLTENETTVSNNTVHNNVNFFQTVCKKHEWIKVVATSVSAEDTEIRSEEYEQCRFCGIMRATPDYHTHLSNLIKIIESLGAEHGHSLNPEFKKQFEDAKKLIQ